MTKATSSKKTATTKKSTKTATKPATGSTSRTAASRKTATSRKSTTTARKTATKKTTTAKKAAPAKKTATKKATVKSTTPKKEATKKTTAAKTAESAASEKSAATAARKTSRKTATSAESSPSPKPTKQSEKKSVKSAAKVPAAKAKPKSTADDKPAEDDKPKIAPAPMRPALRVAKRAEARRDKNQTFKVNTQIIYPAHGVGYIDSVEKQSIADIEVELFVIDFEHEKMKLRVPVAKAAASGMRNLSSAQQINDALTLLEGKARIKRTMWSRRAQEYEAKINSGDLISVAEVVRDLFRADDQPEQSYSERQLFEQARERFGREVAAVRKKTLEKAIEEIHVHLDRKEKADAS